MISNIVSITHEFFFFLGIRTGVLFRASVELLLFFLVTYMILSEYNREGNIEYKYLSMAFGVLALQRLIIVLVSGSIVFGGMDLSNLNIFLPSLLNFIEIFAFILLANAFIYPYKKNYKKITSLIDIEVLVVLLIAIVIQVLWMLKVGGDPYYRFSRFYGFPIYNIIKITFLVYPLFIIPKIKASLRYRSSLIIAFLLMAFVPFFQTISYFLYGDLVRRIDVFLNPFPFISVMVFTRIVYLKLVDKVFLKDRLKISQEKYKVAKELSDMKDSFVSVVSHELRTPLTSMKLYSKLLNKGKFGKLNVKQKKAIGVISDETDRLSELINDMLNLSKLESKKDPLKITSFDFYKFSKNHHVYGLANEKGIKVKIEVPKRFLLRVDVEKFKQVFINLLSNAIKFTEKKGIITVIARDELNFWEITIKDTGSGIPAEQVPKLFDKFFQVENYMTRYQGGTGLGLAIVKKIIDLHGGEIKVESEIGKGSSFIISIPKKIK
tara:strand:- start:6157 stop:7635 length:1479 start_codon:yes stop_codon:yes gene_type:complete